MNRTIKKLTVFFIFSLFFFPVYCGAIKIVTWNILNFPGTADAERIASFRMVIDELDPDIIVVQEMSSQKGVNLFLRRVLNHTSSKEYRRIPFIDGPDTDNAVFFKKKEVYLVSKYQVTTAFRDISEYAFRIKRGQAKGSRFQLYSVHFTEGTSSDDEQAREKEARVLRDYLNTLPPESLFIVCGCFNFATSQESAFQVLTGIEDNNAGRLKDPIDKSGPWHDKKRFAILHTQSTRMEPLGEGAAGGLDDRFDMFLISYGLAESLELSYKPESYEVYGNDGEHLNRSVNDPANKAVDDAIADALWEASDHLPVLMELTAPDRSIPLLISPENGATLDNGRTDRRDDIIWDFSWTGVPRAYVYHLCVQHSGAAYPVINAYIHDTSYHHVSAGAYIIDSNRFNWKWMVRSLVGNTWSEWSEIRKFKVEPVNTDPPAAKAANHR